jgi:hypothetical protein
MKRDNSISAIVTATANTTKTQSPFSPTAQTTLQNDLDTILINPQLSYSVAKDATQNNRGALHGLPHQVEVLPGTYPVAGASHSLPRLLELGQTPCSERGPTRTTNDVIKSTIENALKLIVEQGLQHNKKRVNELCGLYRMLLKMFPGVKEDHYIPEEPMTLASAGVSSGKRGWLSLDDTDLENLDPSRISHNVLAIVVNNDLSVFKRNQGERTFTDHLRYSDTKMKFQYQNWNLGKNKNETSTKGISARALLNNIERRKGRGLPSKLDPNPKNVLSISGSVLLEEIPEPDIIKRLDCTMLRLLKHRVEGKAKASLTEGSSHDGGKELFHLTSLIDVSSCLRFVLYGQAFSFSGWHLDILGGTWLSVLTGIKLWFIYTGPWNESVQKVFNKDGSAWSPDPGDVQIIILTPGRTLVMPPGKDLVVHAVLTVEDSLCAGGMIWPEKGPEIVRAMENLGFIIPRARVTNEYIPRQLPEYLDQLQLLMEEVVESSPSPSQGRLNYTKEQQEKVVEFIESLKKNDRLSCTCKTCDVSICPCLKITEIDDGIDDIPEDAVHYAGEQSDKDISTQEKDYDVDRVNGKEYKKGLVHALGCTAWCHAESVRDPNTLCMLLPALAYSEFKGSTNDSIPSNNLILTEDLRERKNEDQTQAGNLVQKRTAPEMGKTQGKKKQKTVKKSLGEKDWNQD